MVEPTAHPRYPGSMERTYAAGRFVWRASGHNMLRLLGRPEFVDWLKGEVQVIKWEQKVIDNSGEIIVIC